RSPRTDLALSHSSARRAARSRRPDARCARSPTGKFNISTKAFTIATRSAEDDPRSEPRGCHSPQHARHWSARVELPSDPVVHAAMELERPSKACRSYPRTSLVNASRSDRSIRQNFTLGCEDIWCAVGCVGILTVRLYGET